MSGSDRPMSQKYNDDRRNHIPQMAFKVQNWPAYEAGLRRHGSAITTSTTEIRMLQPGQLAIFMAVAWVTA